MHSRLFPVQSTIFILITLVMTACHREPYSIKDNVVTIHLSDPEPSGTKMLRLTAVTDKVIHVSATPDSRWHDKASLITVEQNGNQESTWTTVTQDDDTLVVRTSEVVAHISLKTGSLRFTDKNARPLLTNTPTEAMTFQPITAPDDGSQGYTTRLRFLSPDDEAFYGLGQHQADEWNWKGRNEELFQYNTKVSIPFVLSTCGYGLLLDSYSLCRWGNPEDYKQLGEVFSLHDTEGHTHTLTGTYTAADGRVLVRQEDSIYFENIKTIKNLPQDFPLDGTNVVYEGTITPTETGEFRFIVFYAGYMRVLIDNVEVQPTIWRTAWNPNSRKFQTQLTAGQAHRLRIEWQPDGNESYCGLRVLPPYEEQQLHQWWSEMTPQLDYYFIAGPSMDEIISGYRQLTGRSPIMPRWAMGFWQSRERYATQDDVLSTLKTFRNRHIPIDNIVQDWSYWPEAEWGSHRFDAKRYPDPKAMVDSVHAMHGHIMISVWPKFYTTTEHFKAFDTQNWIYQQSVRDSLRDWIGQGYTYGFYDAYSEDARKLFWQQMNECLYQPYGFDAWWMDASEPNIRDCTDLPYRKSLCGPTALGSSTEYFNAYALENAEAIYNGQRTVNPNDRVFLLTRSGFAGLQRYSTATWSGDIGTRWEDMKAQLSAGLNFSISGIPWWTMDIGGFSVEKRYMAAQGVWDSQHEENADLREWRELNARWHQFGAFCPLYRTHGQWPLREVWNIAPEGHPAYESILYYHRLRYRLLPYIYSLAAMTHFEDYTLMRPLVMDHPTDTIACNVSDQFFFGPALMVAPIFEYGTRQRAVYLPEGTWYDFYTSKIVKSGLADAPYERIPLFVRGGSILPVGPSIEYTDERPADLITIYVYAGANGTFTLYEDEGTNYNYEKGQFATIPLHYDDTSHTLTIGSCNGSFPGMLQQRRFRVVFVAGTTPHSFEPDGNDGIMVNYNGHKKIISL